MVTVDLEWASGDVVIDLRAATLELEGGGVISGARTVAGGFTNAHGVVAENAVTGVGADRVIDCTQGEDRLRFDPELWGGATGTPRQIVRSAHVIGDGVDFVFDGGDRLLLEGLTTLAGLSDAILA